METACVYKWTNGILPGELRYCSEWQSCHMQLFGAQTQPGLGNIGDMMGNQSGQQANARNDPNKPSGNINDILADYSNTQGQRGQFDL